MGQKRIPVTQLILFFLEKSVGAGELFVESMGELRHEMRRGVYHDYPRQPLSEPTISQAIRRLRERGFLEMERKQVGEIVLRLTKSGREFALLTGQRAEWDGRWRIVVFDIPESKRAVRNALRGKLKQWGFVQWQKSVWATKKPVTEKLRQIVKELEIEQWVLVIESDDTGKEGTTKI